jgi:GNAT superfamily N-acetyltransferase
MNTQIRQATTQDLTTLLQLGKKLHQVELQFEPLLKYSEQEATNRYTQELRNDHALFLIAEEGSLPIGYLYAHIDQIDYFSTSKPECEIEVIYLEKEARGKGVSKQLVDSCISWAKKSNVFRIKAGIYHQNQLSLSSFQKYGFKPYHTTLTFSLE